MLGDQLMSLWISVGNISISPDTLQPMAVIKNKAKKIKIIAKKSSNFAYEESPSDLVSSHDKKLYLKLPQLIFDRCDIVGGNYNTLSNDSKGVILQDNTLQQIIRSSADTLLDHI